MVFEDTGNISPEDNEQFWEKIRENFQQTKELLEYIAQEEGIDLDNLPQLLPGPGRWNTGHPDAAGEAAKENRKCFS
jgi:hypothetical protein